MSHDPAVDTRRWQATNRDASPPGPPAWPWLFVICVAMFTILRLTLLWR